MANRYLSMGRRAFFSIGRGQCARENVSNQFGHRSGHLPDSALPGSRMVKVAGYKKRTERANSIDPPSKATTPDQGKLDPRK
jgi:hypothetical protein